MLDSPVRTGNAWLLFELVALFRTIPRPAFEKMELPRMLLPVPDRSPVPVRTYRAAIKARRRRARSGARN